MVKTNILKLSLLIGVLLLSASVSGRSTFLINELGKNAASDLESWNVRNSEGPYTTNLNGVTIVGGHGSFGSGAELSKHYRELPDHYKLKVEFIFYGIQTWEDENFFLNVDGRQVYSITNTCDCNKKTTLFGSDLHTKVVKVEVEFAHYRSDLLLKFGSNLDEPAINESWGISDLQISYITCEGDCLVVTDEISSSNFDLKPFQFSPEPNTEITTCNNGKQIVGGPGAFAKDQTVARTLKDLPPHSQITVHFLVFFFGEFDREAFRVSVDETGGKNRVSVTNPLVSSGEEGSFCSSNDREEIRDVVLTFPHTSNDATIHFFDESFDQTSSWGISDLRVYVNPCRGGKRCQVISNEIFSAKRKIKGWTLPSGPAPLDFTNTCNKKIVFGGLNKLSKDSAQKKFRGLKPHNEVSISFKFFKFGTWSPSDVVYVFVDKVLRRTIIKTAGQDSLACGSDNLNTEVENVVITVPHSSSNLRVQFVSTLCKEPSEHAYGFREFYVQSKQGRGVELVDRDFGASHEGDDLNGWTMDPVNESPFTTCGKKNLFGGLSVFTSNQRVFKTYKNLPVHQWVRVVFNAFLINDWSNNSVDVLIDGRLVGQIERKNSKRGIKSALVCGSNEEVGDEFITDSVTFQHHSDSFTLEFKTYGEDSNQSWGLNNIQVWTLNDLPDAATDGSTAVDEFNDYEEKRAPEVPNQKSPSSNPFFAPPSIRRVRRKPKQFIDPEDEVCADDHQGTTEVDTEAEAEKERVKNELERQIEETQKQLESFKGQLKDIHPEHPYVQENCDPPTPQEKKVIEEIVEEIRVIEEKIEELEQVEDPTPEEVQELEELKIELEVKQEVLKVEEQKYEEKIEKFEAQEESKPEYQVKCTLNLDVIQGLVDKIKDTKQRISRRNKVIHELRLKVANSDEEDESVKTIQARITKNENNNRVAVEKIAKFEARINRLETVCKPLKHVEKKAEVEAAKPGEAARPGEPARSEEVVKSGSQIVLPKTKQVKKDCAVNLERIKNWQEKLVSTRDRIAKRQQGIEILKQKLLASGANEAALNAQIEKSEANQEKARDKLSKYEVKIENETYKCEAKPEPTKEEVVEKIIEKEAELEELKSIPDPEPEVVEKIEALEIEVEELKAKVDEIEMESIQKEAEIEQKKEEIEKKKKRIRVLKRRRVKTPKQRRWVKKQIKKIQVQIEVIKEDIKKEEAIIEQQTPEIVERKLKIRKSKLKKRAKKLEVYLEKHPELPPAEVKKIEEEIKVIEEKLEVIEERIQEVEKVIEEQAVTPAPDTPKSVIQEVREEFATEDEPVASTPNHPVSTPNAPVSTPDAPSVTLSDDPDFIPSEPEAEAEAEVDCCTAMYRQITDIQERIQKRRDKIRLLKKGLKICTLNKEALRTKIYSLKVANKKALRKIKDIEYLYANYGTCNNASTVEEEPEPLIPEPIPGCKRVESLDTRYIKRIEKINKLKKVIRANPGKNNARLEKKLAALEEANAKATYIRDKIDCDEKPEIPEPEPVSEPEPAVVEPTPETKVEVIREKIGKRKLKIKALREANKKNPSLKKEHKIEQLEEQNEQALIRLGKQLRKAQTSECREEKVEKIREQVDEQNKALSQAQRVERIRARIAQRDSKIRILQNRCLHNNAFDNSRLEEQIVQLEAANERALKKIAEITGSSFFAELTNH